MKILKNEVREILVNWRSEILTREMAKTEIGDSTVIYESDNIYTIEYRTGGRHRVKINEDLTVTQLKNK